MTLVFASIFHVPYSLKLRVLGQKHREPVDGVKGYEIYSDGEGEMMELKVMKYIQMERGEMMELKVMKYIQMERGEMMV